MIRNQKGDVPYYSFDALGKYPQVLNAVFTRLGTRRSGRWGLNVGRSVGDSREAVDSNHRLIYDTLGISGSEVVTARQVHGNRVGVVGRGQCGSVVAHADALITSEPDVILMLRFADCVPILLYDPRSGAVGLVHAGWRGTAAQVAPRAIGAMRDAFGTRPEDVFAALGPAVGPCCYQVGAEVTQALEPTLLEPSLAILDRHDGHYSVDLWQANAQQLTNRGVRQLEIGRMCTSCHVEEFFSHRAEGGQTGRFAVLLGVRGE